ncbi:MAG TPA: hypothetical protein VKT83_13740 [bacterium]|nr:hypothetical protein [bacterium]
MSDVRWPRDLGEFLTFLYAPQRLTRKYGLIWGDVSDILERTRRFALTWLYHRAQLPLVGPDGERMTVPAKPIHSPKAARTRHELFDVKYPPEWTDTVERMAYEDTPEMVETERFLIEGNPHLIEGWHPLGVNTVLRIVERQAKVALRRKWKVCPLCARVFPAYGKTRACPPCRRRWTRRQVQRRLKRAPKNPIVFRYFKPYGEPQLVYLKITDGVRAPGTLHRLTPHSVGWIGVRAL